MKHCNTLPDCIVILVLVLTGFLPAFSQDRCGTVEYMGYMRNNHQLREDDSTFEQWLTSKIQEKRLRTNAGEIAFQIPVVIHVIHKGEAIGSGSNITEAQIMSQISVLNSDFNRKNADTVNTPSSFLPVAGKLKITFVMARQTPEGLPTNGILRVKGSKNSWSVDDDVTLKAMSYWPAEDYLNLWVTDLSGSLMGYAQFPVSTLPGLEGASVNRLTDGVVVDYRAFGSIDDGDFNLFTDYNKGRAATHEIGHFLGLRHIWGDDDGACGGNGDYVSDTPEQGDHTNGCPAHPYITCSTASMFQNYMDYTNDNCMNIFTAGQTGRMETVLNNSPRRNSLLNSPGLADPYPVQNDLGIADIASPAETVCNQTISPKLHIVNNGTNPITTTTLKITANDQEVKTEAFYFNPPLPPSETAEITFVPFARAPGSYRLTFDIVTTNEVDDAKLPDNKKNIDVTVLQIIALPAKERFEVMPSGWLIRNPDASAAWSIHSAPAYNPSNRSLYLNFYQSRDGLGEADGLLSPVFDLSHAISPYLIFDVAYAPYPGRDDGLKVYVISGCASADTGIEVYSKSGSSLATVTASTGAFVPSRADHWRREVIDLHEFIGKGRVQLVFTGINDRGNNLYIDNIQMVAQLAENIAIKKITRPSPVLCSNEIQPSLVIENEGNIIITSLLVRYAVNNGEVATASFAEGISLQPDEVKEITLPSVTLAEGENTISFEVAEPNGLADIFTEGNNVTIKVVVNEVADRIPLRENFDDDDWSASWTAINSVGSSDVGWKRIVTQYNESLYVNSYDPAEMFDEAWLVSPVLDFSGTSEASLFFDLSYRHANDGNDRFKILASRDCGVSYDAVLFDKAGGLLSGLTDEVSWKPTDVSHWQREYVNLNALAGEEGVRIALVFTNGNGNNFYLDNLEFFASDEPAPLSVEAPYTLYGNPPSGASDFYITFNLSKKQPVKYELVDITGKLISREEWPDVLNQTFRVECRTASQGLYVVRLLIGGRYYANRVVVSQ